jgi:competence protein ComEA
LPPEFFLQPLLSPRLLPVANQPMKVDISGAVNKPGVYQLAPGSRVEDAIQIAGGLLDQVDAAYISRQLNLAQKLSDGMKLYIPYKQETKHPAQIINTVESQRLISINQSTLSELDQLPGIGLTTAQKIIDKRPYQSVEELTTKKVISKSLLAKLRDKISL